MPETNGARVEELVQRALLKNPQINITAVSEGRGPGDHREQPYGFAAKQLLDARNGKSISTRKLHAIARRLGELLGEEITAEDLTRADERAAGAAAAGSELPPVGSTTAIGDKAIAITAYAGANVQVSQNESSKESG